MKHIKYVRIEYDEEEEKDISNDWIRLCLFMGMEKINKGKKEKKSITYKVEDASDPINFYREQSLLMPVSDMRNSINFLLSLCDLIADGKGRMENIQQEIDEEKNIRDMNRQYITIDYKENKKYLFEFEVIPEVHTSEMDFSLLPTRNYFQEGKVKDNLQWPYNKDK